MSNHTERPVDPEKHPGILVTVVGGLTYERLPPGANVQRVTIWDWDVANDTFDAGELREYIETYDELPQWMKDDLGDITELRDKLTEAEAPNDPTEDYLQRIEALVREALVAGVDGEWMIKAVEDTVVDDEKDEVSSDD